MERAGSARSIDTIVPALRAPRLTDAGFRHAFFTREGGVSEAPWDTLNFAASTGDDAAAVRENIARAARALGVDASHVYFLGQVHGVAARVLDGREDRDDVVRTEGDITASRTAGVACGVRSADCTPVLLADRTSGAVVAVHSGWRGTVQRAVVAGAALLRELAGGPIDAIAAVGPHIERCCFEVGDDVAAELEAASRAERPVVGRSADPGKCFVDLRAIVRAQLVEAGITAIDDVAGCTVCDARRFHSYRRDGARSGRMLSAIVARG